MATAPARGEKRPLGTGRKLQFVSSNCNVQAMAHNEIGTKDLDSLLYPQHENNVGSSKNRTQPEVRPPQQQAPCDRLPSRGAQCKGMTRKTAEGWKSPLRCQ